MRNINLIPPDYIEARKARVNATRRHVLIGTATILAGLWATIALIHLTYLDGRIEQLTEEKQALDAQLDANASHTSGYTTVSRQLSIIEHFRSPAPLLAILSHLADAIPADTALTNLTVGSAPRRDGLTAQRQKNEPMVARKSLAIDLTAFTTSNTGAPAAVRELSNTEAFEDIRLEESHPSQLFGHELHTYRISMTATIRSATSLTHTETNDVLTQVTR